jgi:hypothetical protein
MVVILFTTQMPSRFTDALEAEGLEVTDALLWSTSSAIIIEEIGCLLGQRL